MRAPAVLAPKARLELASAVLGLGVSFAEPMPGGAWPWTGGRGWGGSKIRSCHRAAKEYALQAWQSILKRGLWNEAAA